MDYSIIKNYIFEDKYVIKYNEFLTLIKSKKIKEKNIDNTYLDFIIFQQKNKLIINNNFEEIYTRYTKNNRFNFNDDTKLYLEKESCSLCCLCSKRTFIFEQSKVYNIGQAAHIISASPNGPRTSISDRKHEDYIKSKDNGIWLCPTCHIKIDSNENDYNIEKLKTIKNKHLNSIDTFNHYNNIPELVKNNLSEKNIENYFNNFKTKKDTLEELSLNEIIEQLSKKTDGKCLVIKEKGQFIFQGDYLTPTNKILLSDFVKNINLYDENYYIYNDIIKVILSIEIINNKNNVVNNILNYQITPAYKIKDHNYILKSLKKINVQLESTQIDIYNTYCIKLNSGHELWFNKNGDFVFFVLDLLIFNIMKIMHIEIIISVNGTKQAYIFR